jgi:parvulin-like peptidyl-prolyl isomerase
MFLLVPTVLVSFGVGVASSVAETAPPADSPTATTEDSTDPIQVPDDALAIVNGEAIHAEDVERLLGRIHQSAADAQRSDFDLERAMFRLVNDALIAQEARAMGMADDPQIAEKLERYRNELALRYFEREAFGERAEATEEEITALFAEQYRIVQLRVVSSYDEPGAKAMLAELHGGADMETMARERSVDPIAIRGGLMKPAPRIDLQREVAETAFSMQVGELGGPIRTPLGWVVFRVEAFEGADPARLEELRPTLNALIRQTKTKALRAELVANAREHHPVRVNQDAVAAITPKRLPDARLIPEVPDPDAVVVAVGGHSVLASDYGAALIGRWKGVRNEEAAVVAAPIVLNGLIQQKLLLAEALRREFDQRQTVQRRIHAHETRLLVARYLEEVVAASVEVKHEELRAYYEAQKNDFLRPPRLRLGQITVEQLEQAERIRDLLRDGADLGWLAEQHSIDGFEAKGGDRGWFEPTPGLDSFNDRLLESEVGDVLEPFGLEGHFAVIKVLAREEQGPYPYEQISGNIRQAALEQKTLAEIDRYIDVLRDRSEIEVFEDRLNDLQIAGTMDHESDEGGTASGHGH